MTNRKSYTVFISYSHQDEGLMKELRSHLSPLRRTGVIDDWCDHEIKAGSDLDAEIARKLEEADLILLLVSSNFIDSEYCYSKEMKKAFEQHYNRKSIVIPIIIRPCDWESSPLSKLKLLPKDGKAVTSWMNIDEAWTNVVNEIKKSIGSQKLHKEVDVDNVDQNSSNIKKHLVYAVDQIDNMYQQPGYYEINSLTGFKDIDCMLGSRCEGKLIVVASRAGMGKTAFVSNIAIDQSVKNKAKVIYFSLAMSGKELVMRMFSSLGRIDNRKIMRGQLDDQDWPSLTSAVGLLSETSIFIDVSPNQTISIIYETIKNSGLERGNGLIIIDPLQLLLVEENSRPEFYSDLTNKLKNIATEFNVPVVMTLPIPSYVDNRPNKRPLNYDLGVYGNAEDNADIIIYIYRDEVYYEDSPDRGTAEIIVSKNNNGQIGVARLTFIGPYLKFEDYIAR